MPKIEASNIEEHIRVQTIRILDAAGDLFRTNGFRTTDMGDIASAMGLARNSLYRYYASKDHILVACMQRDMRPFIEQISELEESIADPVERINAWLDLQIELATGPCIATIKAIGDIRELSPELRTEIAALHEPQSKVLESAVADVVKGTRRDVRLLTGMISSMVQSAAGQVIERGRKSSVLRELRQSVARVLAS